MDETTTTLIETPVTDIPTLDPSDDLEAALRAPVEVSKPDISHLKDALGPDGKPRFKDGDKLVIERYASSLRGNPYLDTRSYRVISVDHDNGNILLYDEDLMQHAGDNWKTGPARGYIYKFAQGTISITTKKKRGRPKKATSTETPKPVLDANGKPVKKKRGRPPGVKNRDKEVIKAEKAAKVAVKKAKIESKKKTKKSPRRK